MSPIRALIFDLDGVLRLWSHELVYRLLAELGVPPVALEEAVAREPACTMAKYGFTTHDDWIMAVTSALAETHPDAAEEAVRYWSTSRGMLAPKTVEHLTELRSNHAVAILTNSTDRYEEDIQALGLNVLVDAVSSSCRTRIPKPSPHAFLGVCARLSVEPGECLYTDDLEEHVVGARHAGLHAFEWSGWDDYRARLHALERAG